MRSIQAAVAAALNRLLDAESWARERMLPFSGETIALEAPLLPPLFLAIGDDGRLSVLPSPAEPTLTLRIGFDVLPALVRGEADLEDAVHVSGNAKLAGEVAILLRRLRWDAEEDLSRWIGDIAAHRVVEGARGFRAWQADAARRLAAAAVEHATGGQGLLATRAEFDTWTAGVAALAGRLEQFEARLRRIGG